MADYRLYNFYKDPPRTYQEAMQQAIRHFIQTHRQPPATIIAGPTRLAEARQSMGQINRDLMRARLANEEIPLEVIGGCLEWEVGLASGPGGEMDTTPTSV